MKFKVGDTVEKLDFDLKPTGYYGLVMYFKLIGNTEYIAVDFNWDKDIIMPKYLRKLSKLEQAMR